MRDLSHQTESHTTTISCCISRLQVFLSIRFILTPSTVQDTLEGNNTILTRLHVCSLYPISNPANLMWQNWCLQQYKCFLLVCLYGFVRTCTHYLCLEKKEEKIPLLFKMTINNQCDFSVFEIAVNCIGGLTVEYRIRRCLRDYDYDFPKSIKSCS